MMLSHRQRIEVIIVELFGVAAVAAGLVHLLGWHHLDSRFTEVLLGVSGVLYGVWMLRVCRTARRAS